MNTSLATSYVSSSQVAKILTENWIASESYCPNCLDDLIQAKANARVLDFSCEKCFSDFELKSKKGSWSKKITDGAYDAMISRLNEPISPHFLFLTYSTDFKVENLIAVPSYFIQPSSIERRNPLSTNAKRAGWVGCNILSDKIPDVGKISLIKNSVISDKEKVRQKWAQTCFLKETKSLETRGWTLDILNCIETLNSTRFTLNQIYTFESNLAAIHPHNKHIKDKIRQQLQILRDKGLIDFISPGVYGYKKELL